MLKNQMNGLTPRKLRVLLISLIVLSFVLSIVGFWFFHAQLVSYAEQVQTSNATAASSSDDIEKLQKLQKELTTDAVAVTRAKSIVADSQYYQYQNQIISDITTYAKNSGVSITGFDFSNVASKPAAGATAGAVVAPAPAGVKSITASITVKSPAPYTSVMKFIHSIELNLTKMQLSGISMTGSTENQNDVTISPITIEVYTR